MIVPNKLSQSETNTHNVELAARNQEIEQLKVKVDNLSTQLSDKMQRLEALKAKFGLQQKSISDNKKKHDNMMKTLKERLEAKGREISELNEALATDLELLQNHRTDLNDLQALQAKTSAEASTHLENAQKIKEQLRVVTEESNLQLTKAQDTIQMLQSSLDSLNIDLKAKNKKINTYKGTIETLRKMDEDANVTIDDLRKMDEDATVTIDVLRIQIQELKNEKESLEHYLEQAEEDLAQEMKNSRRLKRLSGGPPSYRKRDRDDLPDDEESNRASKRAKKDVVCA
jgi:chromosome segregation ATPase